MLQYLKDIYGNALSASDGEIGHVQDFYFDDATWVVRYLVADTGSWLTGRRVLISPHAFGRLDRAQKRLHVNLTRQRIEHGPSIELHKPVNRQYEVEYYRYYGWPAYWDGAGMWGFGGFPVVMPPNRDELSGLTQHRHRDDKHLQSTHAVTGYEVQASDGVFGHVSGFLVDDESWAIREMVVETGHWFAGKQVLVSPRAIERISYEDSKVVVNLTQADLQRTADHDVVISGGGALVSR